MLFSNPVHFFFVFIYMQSFVAALKPVTHKSEDGLVNTEQWLLEGGHTWWLWCSASFQPYNSDRLPGDKYR